MTQNNEHYHYRFTRLSAALRISGGFLVACVFALLLVLPSVVWAERAETIKALISDARAGKLSLDELTVEIIQSAEVLPEQLSSFTKQDLPFPGFEKSLAVKIREHLETALLTKSTRQVYGVRLLAEKILSEHDPILRDVQHMFQILGEVEELEAKGELRAAMLEKLNPMNDAERAILRSRAQHVVAKEMTESLADTSLPDAMEQIGKAYEKWGGEDLLTDVRELVSKKATLTSDQLLSPKLSASNEGVQHLIEESMRAFPPLREFFLALYEQRAVQAQKIDNVSAAVESLSWVLRHRPDPSQENNQLRKTLAITGEGENTAALRAELLQYLRAKNLIAEHESTELPIASASEDGTFSPVMFLILALLAFFLLVALYVKFTSSFRSEKTWAQRKAEKRGAGYMKAMTEEDDDEYSRLLGKFGLTDGASESDIKKAYRQAMKQAHPDVAAAGGQPDEANFQDLKETYDRIMEIRGSWFGH